MTEAENGSDLGWMDGITTKKRGLEAMIDDREEKRRRQCLQEDRSNYEVSENIHVGTESRECR